jgi:chloramphenicol-sensitive protein RarD
MAHRVIWSLAFTGLLLAFKGRLGEVIPLLSDPRRAGIYLLSGTLIACNWVGFIWASSHGQALQAGLGYYINPLVSVVLGAIWLKERLSWRGKIAILLACAGVGVLIAARGEVPWIALMLAITFGHYGLVRKWAPADALIGLVAETLLLLPLALPLAIWFSMSGQGAFLTGDLRMDGLLVLAGILTAIPLLMFVHAAKGLKLATLGLLQYVNPTMQFVLAVFIFEEPFTWAHGAAFAFIWTGLAVYSWGAWKRSV